MNNSKLPQGSHMGGFIGIKFRDPGVWGVQQNIINFKKKTFIYVYDNDI